MFLLLGAPARPLAPPQQKNYQPSYISIGFEGQAHSQRITKLPLYSVGLLLNPHNL